MRSAMSLANCRHGKTSSVVRCIPWSALELQDVLIPFVLDERIEEDCLFLIFEEDFRFTPEADDPSWKMEGRKDTYQLINEQIFGRLSSPPPKQSASASSSSAAAPETSSELPHRSVEPTAHPLLWQRKLKSAGEYWNTVEKPPGMDWNVPSLLLQDLVAYGILMNRAGKQFAWLGWQPWGSGNEPKNPKQNRYGSGNMLVMMDKLAATRIEYEFVEDGEMRQPGHIDLKLKHMYMKEDNRNLSCYMTPPIGGYSAHISGCAKEFSKTARPTIWAEKFACPGTRPSHDWLGRQKWWASFTERGGCNWVGKQPVNLDMMSVDDLLWKTWDGRKPPDDPEPTAWSQSAESTERKAREARMAMQRLKFRYWAEDEDKAPRGKRSRATHGESQNAPVR